jgi:hypothetical protein
VKIKNLLLAVVLLALAGCSKLTLENYGKIQVGMPEDQVFALIGKPDQCDDVMGIRNCTWKAGNSSVNVSFAAGQVLLFTSHNLN